MDILTQLLLSILVTNRMLLALAGPSPVERLRGLVRVHLAKGQTLCRTDEPLTSAYFPEESLVSFLMALEDGKTVDFRLLGNLGLIGRVVGPHLPFDAVAVVPGDAWRLPRELLLDAVATDPAMQRLLDRYRDYRFFESFSRAACAANHSAMQRLCRTLLQICDRVGDTIRITHELLALMLGVRRPTVTLMLQSLQRSGIVAQRPNTLTVINHRKLELMSCSCQIALHQHLLDVYREQIARR